MRRRITTLIKSKTIILLMESINEFNTDNGTLLAASISFNLFFSIFPLVFIAVYFAGSITGSANVQQLIISSISYLLPESRQLLSSVVGNVVTAHREISVLAFIGVVWGGLSFFNAVRKSLNITWGIHSHQSIFKSQIVNLIMLMGGGILLILSVLLTTMLSTIEPAAQVRGAGFISHSLTTRVLANILVTIIAFLVFLVLYKFIPSRRPKWKDIWKGALATAICFEITKIIFIRYVRIFSPYNLAYGSMGTIIAFLMWTYLSALVFLFIAKITHVNLRMLNSSVISNQKG